MKKVLSMALLVAAMLGTSVGASAQAHRHHRRAARPQTVSIRAEVRNPRFGNSFDRKDARVVRCNRCGNVIMVKGQDFRGPQFRGKAPTPAEYASMQ